jgi:Tfp pilus assembly protein PilO
MEKIELTKEKLMTFLPVAVLVTVIGISLIFYIPLMKKSRVVYAQCKAIEDKARKTKNVIKGASVISSRRVLMTEEDVSYATNELTRLGKQKGIDFVSIRPKDIQKEKGEEYKILPVELQLESTYKELGMFLGSLDDVEKSLITVKSFNIVPAPGNTARLITDLVVDVYLSARDSN